MPQGRLGRGRGHRQLDLGGRRVQRGSRVNERSRAGAEWVIAPIDTNSTPEAACSRMLARVTPPLASRTARPATCATAARRSAGLMLSSSRRRAPAARASSISAGLRHSIWSGSSGAWARAAAHGRAHAPGHGDVVLLDQDRVVEAEPVVGRAPGGDRGLLERTQAGRRLARVEHARAGPLDGPRAARGERGDAREAAEEVERRALGADQRPGRALDLEHGSPLAPLALGGQTLGHADVGVETAEDGGGDRRPKITPGAF